jgi:5-formyltetrahydrofolate cyclo-ligase
MGNGEEERAQLRKHISGIRKRLSPEQKQEASQCVCKRLKELTPLAGARTIMGYSPINNEIDIIPFLSLQKERGKTVLLPRVENDGRLSAVEFVNWDMTRSSSFGIKEPLGKPWPLDSIDAVLVPGLVFDANGYRLGYGRGYYDRFLPGLNQRAFKCGVAYEFQVIDNVFPREHDVPVHWIVTEKSEVVVGWAYF